MDSIIREIVSSSIAENTRIAYDKAWYRFLEFCERKHFVALPATPNSVIEFFVEFATQPRGRHGKPLSMSTLVLYRSAINFRHVEDNHNSPTRDIDVIKIFKGLMRMRGTSTKRVRALRENHIELMLEACGTTPIGIRNASLIAIGFSCALRRSEICNLRVEDISFNESKGGEIDSMFLLVRKSKTDQLARGQRIAVPAGERIKPIKRLQDWFEVSGIERGYIFQTMKKGGNLRGNPMHHSDIPRIVKHYAQSIGLDTSNISGHSLRAGFVTSAAAHHARLDKIMEITRHTNPSTVLTYIRDTDAFTDHAGEGFL